MNFSQNLSQLILFYFSDFERKTIRATAAAQQVLKCPVSFHPGRNAMAPFEIMRIFTEAGGDAKKVVMSHLDRKLCLQFEFILFS